MSDQTSAALDSFGFPVPKGYTWLLERGLVSYEPFGSLQPWHYLDAASAFDASQRWPNGPVRDRLIAFAKRQDTDDLACFRVREREVLGVALIHGWTPEGYALVTQYDSFWTWLKAVVDDVAAWAESAE